MRRKARIVALLFVLSVFFGCGGGGGGSDENSDSDNPCSDINARVFGGYQCDYSGSPVIALLMLNSNGDIMSTCTGAMVTTDDVLTAAHCVSIPGTAEIGVYVGQELVRVSRGAIHSGYDGSTESPYDIAMVTLERPIGIAPVPLHLSTPLQVGDSVTAFGYGKNEDYQYGPSDYRAARMRVAAIGGGLFATSFDDAGTSICQGDSGGPVTKTVNGHAGIVGVTSFTVAGCTTGSFSGFVDIQRPDIYDAIIGYAPDVPTN